MIEKLVRPEVASLVSYNVQSKESNQPLVILDGNESPFSLPKEIEEEITQRLKGLELNRYPDTSSKRLCKKISDYLGMGVSAEQIIVGNGSEEILQYLIQTFIGPNDRVLALTPTFSMYKIFTRLGGGLYEEVHLTPEGELDLDKFWERVNALNPKMIFLCSPNNPTGTTLPLSTVAEIVTKFPGIVVVDEAYAEFNGLSMIQLLESYPNLVITRTFSKALGLAGIRLGYMVANLELKHEVAKVVSPYNLNSISQMIGEVILDNYYLIEERVFMIIQERERVRQALEECPGLRIFPSKANFLYVQGTEVTRLADSFANSGIIVRRFTTPQDAIRITIGTPEENTQVIKVIESFC